MIQKIKKILFWQAKIDYLKIFDHSFFGELNLITLNYSIWFFFFYLSFLLINKDINFFGRLFVATLFAEVIEKFLKKQKWWIRPMFNRRKEAPAGLVNNWYYSGSFPSGHTMKTVYFFMFILFSQVISLPIFIAIVVPLITFRVLVGFHYPIDIIGGVAFGFLLWFLTKSLVFPETINSIIQTIFNYVFFGRP